MIKKKQEIVEDNPPDASSPIPSVVVRGASKSSRAVGLLGEVHLWGNIMKSWIIVSYDDDDGDDGADGVDSVDNNLPSVVAATVGVPPGQDLDALLDTSKSRRGLNSEHEMHL